MAVPRTARVAISLHSHSSCSRETLAFIPKLARRIRVLSPFFESSLAQYERVHGEPLDFGRYYWRPPLVPAAVVASERRHLEDRLERPALVSLTDHDTVAGPRALRAAGQLDVPLSVEWSIVFAGTIFHLGVHAISPAHIDEAERVLADYTFRGLGDAGQILDWLTESPETFVVLNHPYWDMARVGLLRHDSTLLTFLRTHRRHIHALELNGYRDWSENRRVLPLAEGFGLPVVGGGDRHGRAPNTIVNLISAGTLGEFAGELRAGRSTCCVVFPEYEDPFLSRLLQGAADCLSTDVDTESGERRTWDARVLATRDTGDVPLSAMWEGAPWWLQTAVGMTRLLGSAALRPMFRLPAAFGRSELRADVWSALPSAPMPQLDASVGPVPEM